MSRSTHVNGNSDGTLGTLSLIASGATFVFILVITKMLVTSDGGILKILATIIRFPIEMKPSNFYIVLILFIALSFVIAFAYGISELLPNGFYHWMFWTAVIYLKYAQIRLGFIAYDVRPEMSTTLSVISFICFIGVPLFMVLGLKGLAEESYPTGKSSRESRGTRSSRSEYSESSSENDTFDDYEEGDNERVVKRIRRSLQKNLNHKGMVLALDTNVFMDCPDYILSLLYEGYSFAVSKRVYDELDGLKKNKQKSHKARKGIRVIDKIIRSGNINLIKAKTDFLEYHDLDPSNSDEVIIGEYLMEAQYENVLFITSDAGCKILARSYLNCLELD